MKCDKCCFCGCKSPLHACTGEESWAEPCSKRGSCEEELRINWQS
jgi:hypothetical protein